MKINPKAAIRTNQGDKIVFRIPEECPVGCGLPRRSNKNPLVEVETMADQYADLWEALGGEKWRPRNKKKFIRYGCPHMISESGLIRKRRIERYNDYKEALSALCKQQRFTLPQFGWALYFYVPVPKWWTKKKKIALHGQHHLIKSDLDNFEKGFYDSLSVTDEQVGQLSGHGKFWVNQENGYIEILLQQPVYNPFGVVFIDQTEWFKKKPAIEKKPKIKKEKLLV